MQRVHSTSFLAALSFVALAMSSANCNCDGSPPANPQDTGSTRSDATMDASIDGSMPRDIGFEGDGSLDATADDIGPSDGNDALPSDARADAMPGDARDAMIPDGPSDGGMPRDAGDGGPPCVNNMPCDRGSQHGICMAGVCNACTDVQDDSRCSTAYGGAPNTYLCVRGSCTRGNCRSNSQCPMGNICGLATAFTCSPCANDSQCASDFGYPNTICEISSGRCVSNSCTLPPHRCAPNPNDICCPNPPGPGGICTAGNCCTNAQCTGGLLCVGGTCTQCTAAIGGVYYVNSNPAVGNDSARTGSSNCPFRTLTHAFAFLGSSPPADTTINVSGGLAFPLRAPNEDFPLVVPRNVHLVGNPNLVPTLVMGEMEVGFVLNAPNSSISRFVIDGQAIGDSGIEAVSGSALTTTIDHLTVRNFAGDGIVVRNSAESAIGGMLSIGAGVVSTGHGSNPLLNTSGLFLTDNATAVITGATTGLPEDQISFSNNSYYGIWVTGRAQLTLTGTAAMGGGGNIIANSNYYGGMSIEQSAGAGLPLNQITGLSAWDNGPPGNQGDGIVLVAGSHARVRRCILLNNHGSGINVTRDDNATSMNTDVTGMDIGLHAINDPGRNILQVSIGGSNIGAGICLYVDSRTANLQAHGNIFSGPNDCARVSPPRISFAEQCFGRVDVATESTTVGQITTSNCAH